MKTPQARKGTLFAALAGLLAAVGGVGVSMLLAAVLGGESAAVALGSRVIDLTPGALKDWAVAHLGTNDKPVLLTSVFVVMAIASAVVGVIARRNLRLGLTLAAVLNLVAVVAAVLPQSGLTLTATTLLPGMAALVVSCLLLWWFARSWSTADPGTGDKPAPFDRRSFLLAAAASGVAGVAGAGGSQFLGKSGEASRAAVRLPAAASGEGPVPAGASLGVKGITPYLTSNADFYRVDAALSVPQIDANTWKLNIHGMVDNPFELSYSDILKMPLVERRVTLTCVSNQVGDEYVGNATWLGVPLRDLMKRAGIQNGADCAYSTAADGMTINSPLGAYLDGRDALLAVGMNGQPLPLTHGFPARLVVPGLYGFVSATKWITDLEITKFSEVNAYWTQRGWSTHAPIKTESRIDVPKQFDTVQAGTVMIGGVAWAQQRGIKKVQVRIDGGQWTTAKLSQQDGIDTWRQWAVPWKATSGQHKLEVRATDDTGYTQTQMRVPPRPDGATGWHSVIVNVA